MELVIIKRDRLRVPRGFLKRYVREIVRQLRRQKIHLPKSARELVLVFVSSKEIQRLNREFRKKNAPTDVLSFEAAEASTLGELVLCSSVLRKQAREHGLQFQQELGYMILHGVLHLLGFDHEKSTREARRMMSIQDRAFAEIDKRIS